MIQTVAVVPMFAPIRTENACGSVISAVETKPTSMTVMIELDCTSIVEKMPVPTPMRRWLVACAMNFRSPPPAVACNPSERCFIPNRKRPSPPVTVTRMVRISDIFSFMRRIVYQKTAALGERRP